MIIFISISQPSLDREFFRIHPSPDQNKTSKKISPKKKLSKKKIPRYGTIDRVSFGSYVGSPIVWVLPKHGEHDFVSAEEKYRELFLKAVGEKDHFKVAAANTVG